MMAPAHPMARTAATSFLDVIPAEAMIRTPAERNRATEQVEVGALEEPVAGDRRQLERRDTLRLASRAIASRAGTGRGGRRRRHPLPDRLSVADVDRDRDTLRDRASSTRSACGKRRDPAAPRSPTTTREAPAIRASLTALASKIAGRPTPRPKNTPPIDRSRSHPGRPRLWTGLPHPSAIEIHDVDHARSRPFANWTATASGTSP